jgi:predicted nucleic acid-binding protein
MFLLDTNVLSALMAARPEPPVVAWVSAQPARLLYTAAVCEAGILAGLAVMPAGRRRAAIEEAARAMFDEDLGGRVLTFDQAAALDHADIFAAHRRLGRPTATVDLMIAATARSCGAAVVTRNVADFEDAGVTVVDPWTDRPASTRE